MILEWLHEPTDAPQGVVRQDTSRWILADPEFKALLFVFRPLHRLIGAQASQFRVVTQNAIVDGVHCVKLERLRPKTAVVEHCWLNTAREDLPLLWEGTLHGSLLWRVAIQYGDPIFQGWVPDHWTCHYQSLPLTLRCKSTGSTLNQGMPKQNLPVAGADLPDRFSGPHPRLR